MIREFIFYFKKEAQLLINHMMDNDFNIKEEKKEAFFKVEPSLPLSNGNPKVLKFLKTVSPLSNRERQCVELLKQGKSAQATGAILGLSQRTVEHYFDNIKNKLGCHSKWDLLEY
jgi:DNA-binding CsgD family transcriptional regulator